MWKDAVQPPGGRRPPPSGVLIFLRFFYIVGQGGVIQARGRATVPRAAPALGREPVSPFAIPVHGLRNQIGPAGGVRMFHSVSVSFTIGSIFDPCGCPAPQGAILPPAHAGDTVPVVSAVAGWKDPTFPPPPPPAFTVAEDHSLGGSFLQGGRGHGSVPTSVSHPSLRLLCPPAPGPALIITAVACTRAASAPSPRGGPIRLHNACCHLFFGK